MADSKENYSLDLGSEWVKGSETITTCSNEGLMLETSALVGHFTLSTRLSRFTPSLTQPHSLVKNVSPMNIDKEKFISSL